MIAKYKLRKDLPGLKAGAIFEHREWDSRHPDRGNPGYGCMTLGWINGSCQQSWCGDTYIFPGQLADNTEWFQKIDGIDTKEEILAEIEKLKRKVEKL